MCLDKQKQAVLLLAHGAPTNRGGIPQFLRNIFGKRPVSQEQIDETVRRYNAVGGNSLLLPIT